jgi:HAMP domain-containing protein
MQSSLTPSVTPSERAPLSTGRARGGLARFLLFVLLPLVLGPLLTVAFLLYRQARADLSQQIFDQLSLLSQIKEDQLEQWASQRRADLDNLARSPDIISAVRTLRTESRASDAWLEAARRLTERFDNYIANPFNADYRSLMLADADTGEVLIASAAGENMLGQVLLAQEFFRTARTSGALVAPPRYDPAYNPWAVTVLAAAPVADPDLGPTAIIISVIHNGRLGEIISTSAAGQRNATLRSYLVTYDGYDIGGAIAPDLTRPDSEAIQRAQTGHVDGSGEYLNPQRQPVVGVYNWIERYQLILLTEQTTEEAFAPLGRAAAIFVAIIALAVAASTGGVIFFTRRLTQPIGALTEGALRLAGGDLTSQVSITRNDEIGLLAEAFNRMSTDLRELYEGLESKVEARTRQLAAAADVGRTITSILGTEELLSRTVELIRDRFGYYHVTVFLLDESGQYAVLREATGRVGAQLKAGGYRLGVGSNSIIGWVSANRQARIALDVSEDPLHLQSELLPDTRSEAAMPLRIGDRVLGVLDVQSREPHAFTPSDVDTLQILADQIAVTLENGRLFGQQQRVAQLEQIVLNVTTKVYKSLTLDSILENAAVELGRALGARRAVVKLEAAPEPAPGPDDSNGGNGHPLT